MFKNYKKMKLLLDNNNPKNPSMNIYNKLLINKDKNDELNNHFIKETNSLSFDYDDEKEKNKNINYIDDKENNINRNLKINNIIEKPINEYITNSRDNNNNNNKNNDENRLLNNDDNNFIDKNNNRINNNNIKYKNKNNIKDIDKDSNSIDDINSDNENLKIVNINNPNFKDSKYLNNNIEKKNIPKNKDKNNNAYNNSIKQKYKNIIPNVNLYQYQDLANNNKPNKKKIRSHSENKNRIPININKNNNNISKKEKPTDLYQIEEKPIIIKKRNVDNDDNYAFLKYNNSVDNLNIKMDKDDIDVLIGRDKEKLMRYDPIRRNIKMIKNIEAYKKQGIVFPGIRKERKLIEPPLKYCYKFRNDPQKFYTELLCDSMYEALDFKIIKNKN